MPAVDSLTLGTLRGWKYQSSGARGTGHPPRKKAATPFPLLLLAAAVAVGWGIRDDILIMDYKPVVLQTAERQAPDWDC